MDGKEEVMAIEVIVRHAYHEPKYLTRCYQCKSILRFMESDLTNNDNIYCSLTCPVCGYINTPGLKSDWIFETKQLERELDGD